MNQVSPYEATFQDVDFVSRLETWRTVLQDCDIHSAAGVGPCLDDLTALREVLGDRAFLLGIRPPDPFPDYESSRFWIGQAPAGAALTYCDARHIAAPDGQFDLVFSTGYLGSLLQDRWAMVVRELVRLSRRYVLVDDYFWVDGFLRYFRAVTDDLHVVKQGQWELSSHTVLCRWWLFAKHE